MSIYMLFHRQVKCRRCLYQIEAHERCFLDDETAFDLSMCSQPESAIRALQEKLIKASNELHEGVYCKFQKIIPANVDACETNSEWERNNKRCISWINAVAELEDPLPIEEDGEPDKDSLVWKPWYEYSEEESIYPWIIESEIFLSNHNLSEIQISNGGVKPQNSRDWAELFLGLNSPKESLKHNLEKLKAYMERETSDTETMSDQSLNHSRSYTPMESVGDSSNHFKGNFQVCKEFEDKKAVDTYTTIPSNIEPVAPTGNSFNFFEGNFRVRSPKRGPKDFIKYEKMNSKWWR